jgi:hypothetical protein
MAYQYELDTRKIEITDADESGHYTVIWEKQEVGYIYVSDLNDDLGEAIWSGSTPYLNLHAPKIGAYIEDCDM